MYMTINPIFILVNDLSFTNILKDCGFLYVWFWWGLFVCLVVFFNHVVLTDILFKINDLTVCVLCSIQVDIYSIEV